jgi:hypothetical protein
MWTLSQVSQAVKNQTWTGLPPSVVEYLVVAGGGGGGGDRGGGGGAGGLLTGYVGITPGTSYTVTVGAGATYASPGGYVQGSNGSNSIFRDPVSIHVTAVGGGGGGTGAGGGANGTNGSAGGSGGGATGNTGGVKGGGAGISGQGNAGGSSYSSSYISAQGGGGAGLPGEPGRGSTYGTNGGSGIASDISGTRRVYAGGGGGGGSGAALNSGKGGVGGGGNGGEGGTGSLLLKGAVNSGGGGGGSSNQTQPYDGGSGGSGIVVIRYPGTTQFFTGGTLSYANGYISHTFYANGTLAPTAPTKYVDPDYQISRSLRFNSADSTYLTRTPSSASNRKTWTWSGWVKINKTPANSNEWFSLFNAGIYDTATPTATIDATSGGLRIALFTSSTYDGYNFTTTSVRDLSGWYHVVVAVDTTSVIASDRLKIYINGTLDIGGTVSYPTQNYDTGVNLNQAHNIGGIKYYTAGGFSGFANALLAEVNFIDGQALTPSQFGWTNPETGVWAPLKYVGTYGTNGFYLKFADNSNTTAATLGADSSGNGHNWTPNNFSVTAGAGNDSLVDSPTPYGTDTGVGGEVRGNYCTLNPLAVGTSTSLTNGNLDSTISSSTGSSNPSTFVMTTGKWYWEVINTATTNQSTLLGIIRANLNPASISFLSNPNGVYYNVAGLKNIDGTQTAYGSAWGSSGVAYNIGIALDVDGGTVTFYLNGASQGAITLPSNTLGWAAHGFFGSASGSSVSNYNFGQRAFAYTAPSGYKALCTTNLPTPTIGATAATLASEYFDTSIWAGNGDNVVPRIIPSNVDLASGGGLIWFKGRDVAVSHLLVDSVRGYTKYIAADTAAAEDTYNFGIAGTTNGFTFTGSSGSLNQLTYNYVGWQWKAGGTAVTNTSGSITSTVSANPTSGFSIATYTGNGTAGATIGHGLGVAPNLVIVKKRNGTTGWQVYAKVLGRTKVFYLDINNAPDTGTDYWGTSDPTSTVFGLSTDGSINASSVPYMAYFFAEVAGYSAIGSYTGNGSTDGTFVHTGFRPAFVMIKRTSSTGDWFVYNNKTAPLNGVNKYLVWNTSGTEGTYDTLDFLSNGFKLRVTDAEVNGNASTFVFMAIAETPFKYSLAR